MHMFLQLLNGVFCSLVQQARSRIPTTRLKGATRLANLTRQPLAGAPLSYAYVGRLMPTAPYAVPHKG